MALASDSTPETRKIWDLPVRVFHWSLVVLLGAAWWTAEQRMIDWHRLTGYAILAALIFRILWGLAGSSTARFASFVRGPGAVLAYVRGVPGDHDEAAPAGHNPLGGWSVVLMLGLLITQVALGFLAVDIDGLESGPFSYLVDFDTGRAAAEWHDRVFLMLQIIIGVHIAAILLYQFVKRQNLTGAMISGSRSVPASAPDIRFAPLWRAIVLLVISALIVWVLVGYFGQV